MLNFSSIKTELFIILIFSKHGIDHLASFYYIYLANVIIVIPSRGMLNYYLSLKIHGSGKNYAKRIC